MFFEKYTEQLSHFTEQTRKEFFPFISEKDWSYQIADNQLFLGHVIDMTKYDAWQKDTIRCLFKLTYERGVLTFEQLASKIEYAEAVAAFYPTLVTFVEKEFGDCLLSQYFQHCSNALPATTDRIKFYAFGPKAKQALELFSCFEDTYKLHYHLGYVFCHGKSFKSNVFTLRADLTGTSPSLLAEWKGNLKEAVHKTFHSKEAIKAYLHAVKQERSIIDHYEEKMVSHIQQLDPAAYHDRRTARVFIFQKGIPFKFVRKETEKGEEYFTFRFHNQTLRSKSAEEVFEKVKPKVTDYLLKNRLRAVTSGKSSSLNVIPKLYFETTGKHLKLEQIEKQKIFVPMGTGETLSSLLPNLDFTKQAPLSETDVASFQQYLKTKGQRNRIKTGICFGDIFSFVSSTSIFLVKNSFFQNSMSEKEV